MFSPEYGHVKDKYQFKKYTNPAYQQANFSINVLTPSNGRLLNLLGFHFFSHIAGLENTPCACSCNQADPLILHMQTLKVDRNLKSPPPHWRGLTISQTLCNIMI